MVLEEKIQKAAQLVKNANSVVALTGAGISTPSGIPDFRSPKSGLWNQVNPMEVASIIAFKQNPADFYNWIRPLSDKIFNAKPNAAHYALAQLEAAGKLDAVITQNVDNLHQAANSQNVFEVHGHTREMTCINCFEVTDAGPAMEKFLDDGQVPICKNCGGTLKPNVILFGEQLPIQTLFAAKAAAEAADLMIVAGSSLEVAPISDLPYEAKQRGAKLIIVNFQETHMDDQADVVIQEDVTEALSKIVELVIEV